MEELSNLKDDSVKRIYQAHQTQDYSSLTDEELVTVHEQNKRFEERTKEYKAQKEQIGATPFTQPIGRLAQEPDPLKEEASFGMGLSTPVEMGAAGLEVTLADFSSIPNFLGHLVGSPKFAEEIIYEPRTEMGKEFKKFSDEFYLHFPEGAKNFTYEFALSRGETEEEAKEWSELAYDSTNWTIALAAIAVPGMKTQALKKMGLAAEAGAAYISGTTLGKTVSGMKERDTELPLEETANIIPPSQTKPIHIEAGDILTDPESGETLQFYDKKGNPLPEVDNKRLFEHVSTMITDGHINVDHIPTLAQKYDMPPEEIAKLYRQTVSQAGRTLQQLSSLKKRLKGMFAEDPEALEYLNNWLGKEAKHEHTLSNVWSTWQKLDNTMKVTMTSQWATAARNVLSSGAYTAIDAMEKTAVGAMRGTTRSVKEMSLKPIGEEAKHISNYFKGLNRLNPAKRNELFDKLSEANGLYDAVLYKEKLLDKSAGAADYSLQLDVYGDVFMPKTLKVLHSLNRFQERVFQRTLFEAELRYQLSQKGLDYKTIEGKDIPEDALQKALHTSLEKTFALQPESETMKKVLQGWRDMPFMSLVNPFPRFQFANNLKTVAEFGPWTLAKFMSPKQLKAMKEDPTKMYNTLARASIGTAMLGGAVQERMNADPDQRWYEYKVDEDSLVYKSMPEDIQGQIKDGVLDLRPFAPFSNYFLIAESIVNPSRVTPKEVSEAVISMGRVGGTVLALSDLIRGDEKKAWDTIYDTSKQYLNRLFVGTNTFKDLNAGFDPADAVIRSTKHKGEGKIGNFISTIFNNFPELNQINPPKYSVTQGRLKQVNPVLKQLTGLAVIHKGAVQKEADALDLDYTELYNYRTGNAAIDNVWAKYHSKFFVPSAFKMFKEKWYLNAPKAQKTMLFKELLSTTKKLSLETMIAGNEQAEGFPKGTTTRDLAGQVIRGQQLSSDQVAVLLEKGVDAAAYWILDTKQEHLLENTKYEYLLKPKNNTEQQIQSLGLQ
jgi:hypothetical protein